MRPLLCLVSVLFVVLTPAVTLSATPTMMNYQGLLTTAAGVPISDGSYTVVFTIYDSPAGGLTKWTETQSVTTVDGAFSVLLGSITPITATIFPGATRYLGTKVAADPEMTPRIALVSVPYALRVSTIDSASGGTVIGDLNLMETPGDPGSGSIYKNGGRLIHSFGSDNLGVGLGATNGSATGYSNIGVGGSALQKVSTGFSNTAVGTSALWRNETGWGNTACGDASLYDNFAGHANTAVGVSALFYNNIANYNTACGYQAGQGIYQSNTGSNNTAIGYQALFLLTTGGRNTALGSGALYSNAGGISNTGVGVGALQSNLDGINNSAVGENALGRSNHGSLNTALGMYALDLNTSGSNNTAIGYAANVSSGTLNNASAIGSGAIVNASNCMVLGNSSAMRWGFGVNAAVGHAIEVGTGALNGNGAYLTSGGTWTNTSDRDVKEGIALVDGGAVLLKVSQLPIYRWNYKGEDPSHQHVGPMAQDFYAVFSLGDDDKHISTIDPAGVALAAIQALNEKLNQQVAENARTRTENENLRARIDDLSKVISQLVAQSQQNASSQYGMR
jgi:hypothetical protein